MDASSVRVSASFADGRGVHPTDFDGVIDQLEIAGLTSFNRVGKAPRVDGEQTRTSLDARGVAHAVKRRTGAIQSWPTTSPQTSEPHRACPDGNRFLHYVLIHSKRREE